MDNVQPSLKLLSEAQIQQVHAYALRILAETGVRVDSPGVLERLRRSGKVQIREGNVRFPAETVEWAIGYAPSSIPIFDRLGRPAFSVGADRLRFGIGVTALYYQRPQDDGLEEFTRAHMRAMVRLGGRLPLYDAVSTVGILRDVPESSADLYASLDMLANTTKPLVILVSDEAAFGPTLEMFAQLQGDLAGKPFLLPYFNPVSPLVLNAGTLDKMETAIRHGLPFIFSNYSMAGASTPITPAGTLSLLLAELLAGLAVSQVLKEGTPVLLGMLPVYFDMKSMVNFYDPQSILLNLACAEMMAHYHLPHCGTSGSGTGWGADLIAADTYWMNTLSYALVKGGLAPFVGDTLTSKAISPCTLVYVHEVIEQALRLAQGFQLDETQAVLDEIAKAGPGGSFLGAPSTRRNFRTGYYPSPVFPRLTMEKWQAQGSPNAQQVLREKTLELLESAPAPEDYEALTKKGEAFIRRYRRG